MSLKFDYHGAPEWPQYWYSVKLQKNSKKLEAFKAMVRKGLTVDNAWDSSASIAKFKIVGEKVVANEVTLYLSTRQEVFLSMYDRSEWQRQYGLIDCREHYHIKPIALRTTEEKDLIRQHKKERDRRAPIVLGVPYLFKAEDYFFGKYTTVDVFYKEERGWFYSIQVTMRDLENISPEWELKRYGRHEVKNWIDRCKIQDLSFMTLHGSPAAIAMGVVNNQLVLWQTIQSVIDNAPRTAEGRQEELAKHE